ncbi:hypothetical protein [Agromyces larvae]|uniref:Fibronectin type III domain-containing protein n=1 Tax=Agromyces larvae TaxID=2929802 RepID=A0ABY4BV51_9MICO|nr:hypothetical protein [Agromyces larvae]UOE43035.1 hypothetical protein MTO99_12650 [Agromyces larvae]
MGRASRRGIRRFGLRAIVATGLALAMVTGGAAGAAFALEDPAPEPAAAPLVAEQPSAPEDPAMPEAPEGDAAPAAPELPEHIFVSYQGPQVQTPAQAEPLAVEVGGIGTGTANVWWPEVEGAEQYVITTTDGTVEITQPATYGGFARLTGLARDTDYTVQVDVLDADELVLTTGTRSFRTLASFELRGVATGPTTVRLTWAPPLVDDETWIGGDNWAAPLPAGATEFTDHSVLPGQTFSYALLGERVEVTPEVASIAPTVTGTTPTSANFTWPAVYGGSVGVGGHVPRTVTYTVFVDGVQVGETNSLTLDVGGLATAGHRMTIEASVIANRFIDDEFEENVRVVIARGAVDFSTVPPAPAPAPVPAAPKASAGGALARTGADPLPLVIAGVALLTGGVLAAVGASVRPARAAGRNRGPRG